MLKQSIVMFRLLILVILLSSCNPFISKELRKKNRCNRKLSKVVNKCPELVKTDTVTVKINTNIVTNQVEFDTVVNLKFDTLEVVKDKFHLKLIKSIDTLIIEGGCKSDTIIVEKFIKVPFKKIAPIELSVFEQLQNFLGKIWRWILVVLFLLIGFKIYKSYV